MENQPKLNSSKEVIAFLAERFPHCFSAEGEARPLKIGIFQDLVDRVAGEMNLSKTQLRSAGVKGFSPPAGVWPLLSRPSPIDELRKAPA